MKTSTTMKVVVYAVVHLVTTGCRKSKFSDRPLCSSCIYVVLYDVYYLLCCVLC